MKAVIFDVDGVIVDVRNSYHKAIKETVEFFYGKEISFEEIKRIKYEKVINNDWDVTAEILKKYGIEVNYKKLVDKFTEIYMNYKDKETLLLSPALFYRLNKEGVPLGIVTGRPKEDLLFVFNRFGLGKFFSVTIDEDDIWDKNLRKPHPFPLHLCMEALKVKEAVYIGDSPADFEMVLFYRKIYGRKVKFVHFKRAISLNLSADFSTDNEEELSDFLFQEVYHCQVKE